MRLTGVPVATVHHYRRLGLLPPAEEASHRRFVYDDRHVQALLLIRRLRERRQSLEDIRQILPGLMTAEEEAFRPEMWESALDGAALAPDAADRLLGAATAAFVERGYADVTVGEVAAEAGLAKGTVYRHYSSKEDVFHAAVEAAVERVLAEFEAGRPAGGTLPVAEAAARLAPRLQPLLPMVLDLLSGALRGHSGHERAARRAVARLIDGVGAAVQGDGDPAAKGALAVTAALEAAVRSALGV